MEAKKSILLKNMTPVTFSLCTLNFFINYFVYKSHKITKKSSPPETRNYHSVFEYEIVFTPAS